MAVDVNADIVYCIVQMSRTGKEKCMAMCMCLVVAGDRDSRNFVYLPKRTIANSIIKQTA
jgi:hypothetical protein